MTVTSSKTALATILALLVGAAFAVPADAETLGKRKSQRCVINGLEFSHEICKAHKEKKQAEAKKQAEESARKKADQEQREAEKLARKEARREALKDAFVELVKRAAER